MTGRPEKALEAERLGFPLERVDLDLAEPQALEPADVAEAKARAAFERLGRPVLVEDSGLAIEAWGGFPGALVKWLEKTAGLEGIARMLDPFPDRSARAVCAIAYFDGETLHAARGVAEGSIAASPRGSQGFGWDALFVPGGGDRTFAEMAPADKDRVSHRGKAWAEMSRRIG
ncbi:MAG: non-canonical purine NTP pyrophosphatase, RdgB/HAM1 family [Acidobacteriota bacterium]|nr:non-canonical purine NTP pyrophosphatase, RdgB/HAM1 family [Acidobacteriota bacterium]